MVVSLSRPGHDERADRLVEPHLRDARDGRRVVGVVRADLLLRGDHQERRGAPQQVALGTQEQLQAAYAQLLKEAQLLEFCASNFQLHDLASCAAPVL